MSVGLKALPDNKRRERCGKKVYMFVLTVSLLVILVFVVLQPWLWKLYFGVDFPVAIEGLN